MNYLEEIDYRAPDFGELYDELPLWSAPFGWLLLDRVPVRPGLRILDVGTGTGFLAVELAQRCGPDATVIAVDPWTAGVRQLRRKLDRLGLRNVVVVEKDVAAADLAEASIDVVVSNLGLNNFEDVAGVLRACFRAAKPGARLFITTNVVGHMAEFYAVFRATLIELGQQDRLAALDAHIGRRGTLETVSRQLEDAGFQVVDALTDSFRMRFADGSSLLRHYFIRLGFIPGWKAVVNPQMPEKTFATLEHNLNAVAQARGELSLTIPMVCIDAVKSEERT